jgi:hypothetical protein
MTQPRDFPENPVRYRTDDVVKGVYVFQEHVDPATNPYPLPGEERDFVPCSLRVDPALLRGEASPEQIENVRRLIERLRADRPRGHFCLCPRTHTLAGSRVQPRRVRLLGRPADRRIDMASRMDLALTAVISFNLGIVYACMAIWLS